MKGSMISLSSHNQFNKPNKPEDCNHHTHENKNDCRKNHESKALCHNNSNGITEILSKFKVDDVLLIGLIFILLNNENNPEDQAFVIALIFLFLAEHIDFNNILSNILPNII